jgi:hypothetical protein
LSSIKEEEFFEKKLEKQGKSQVLSDNDTIIPTAHYDSDNAASMLSNKKILIKLLKKNGSPLFT